MLRTTVMFLAGAVNAAHNVYSVPRVRVCSRAHNRQVLPASHTQPVKITHALINLEMLPPCMCS